MYKLALLAISFGILRDVATVIDFPNNNPGHSSPDTALCQNNYMADKQSFFVNGRHSSPSSVSLKEGYVVTRGVGVHKLNRRRLTWNAARASCARDGGHLAVINSLAEEAVLLRVLREANVVEAWIGIHDLFEEGEWVTLTGELLEEAGYDNWTTAFPNEPDNLGGNQNCGVLLKVGGIDDVVCTLNHMYICEIDMY
ncbi:hemolymph lipopolysaccharide-binding protein-like isoform X2 [Colletes gigas]|uniref:hemolymph lipopolysaccharide-binding protein-like isoform X2 n=1 Tax=Colletes gigas TaxID=935657 RepID=UPI001C9B8496|nr:hemolymph lipopolysaccharide-binding protein-like isoform X2 [Colletes gigas]